MGSVPESLVSCIGSITLEACDRKNHKNLDSPTTQWRQMYEQISCLALHLSNKMGLFRSWSNADFDTLAVMASPKGHEARFVSDGNVSAAKAETPKGTANR
jgi:hypothetical protein